MEPRVWRMGMGRTLEVLNAMVSEGIIARYAIAGAVAAYNYVEATVTEDLDILVSFETEGRQRRSGLVVLTPLLGYLHAKGYTEFRKEGLMIEGWPVQFLPVADALDAEALAEAEAVSVTIDPVETPIATLVLKPEHLVATALKVGRGKDRARILQFLDEEAVGPDALCAVLKRHGLMQKWASFCARVGVVDQCDSGADAP